jgi:hypothetical protein
MIFMLSRENVHIKIGERISYKSTSRPAVIGNSVENGDKFVYPMAGAYYKAQLANTPLPICPTSAIAMNTGRDHN